MIYGSAAGAVVVLFLASLFLLLKRSGKRAAGAEVTGPAALTAGSGGEAGAVSAGGPGSALEQQIESKLAERDKLQQRLEAEALKNLRLAPVITKTAEVLAKHLRDKVKKEADVTAQILRSWLREEEG